MSGYRGVKFHDLCRLCTSIDGARIPIFSGEGHTRQLAKKIEACLRLEVSRDDGLPGSLCYNCFEKLESVHDFKLLCTNAEATLKSYATLLKNGNGLVYIKESHLETYPPTVSTDDASKKINFADLVESASIEIIEDETAVDSTKENSNTEKISVEHNYSHKTKYNKKHLFKMNNQDGFVKIEDLEDGSGEIDEPFLQSEADSFMPDHEEDAVLETQVDGNDSPTAGPAESTKTSVHVCEICGKVFKRREHLYQHKRLHTGERPYKCDNCSRSFCRKEHLMRHELSHTGQKLYSCDVCSKTFSRKDNVRKHRKTHDVGPFACSTCGKEFPGRYIYNIHKKTHIEERNTAEGTFACNYCNEFFTLKSYLNMHIMTNHLDQLKKDDGDNTSQEETNSENSQDRLSFNKPSMTLLEKALKQAG